MPTRGRAKLAAEAVQMFREQTYENRELIIIDDRAEPSFQDAPEGSVYFLESSLTIGAKRNLACSRASGEVILHWDSDDRYSPDRIEHQVGLLLSHDVDMVGYNIMEFEDVANGRRYLYNGAPGYCIGVSQCYWRDTWEQRPFADVQIGEDESFWFGRRVYSEPAGERIVARIHSGNTSDKRVSIAEGNCKWTQI